MPPYLLTYDLMKEESSEDYKPLWAELKKFGAQKTQYSVWLVSSSSSAQQIHDHFKRLMDSNDRLWVAELTKKHHFSNAMGGTNAWLEKNPPER